MRLQEVEGHLDELPETTATVSSTGNIDQEAAIRFVMVKHRPKVEANLPTDLAELRSQLMATAVSANDPSDLRFIDALNYFFEIDPGLKQDTQFLSLYAGALRALIESV